MVAPVQRAVALPITGRYQTYPVTLQPLLPAVLRLPILRPAALREPHLRGVVQQLQVSATWQQTEPVVLLKC